MNWLPRIHFYGTTVCADEIDDFEGWTLSIVWRDFAFEIVVARRERG